MFVDQTQFVVAQITQLHARVLLVFTVTLLRNKVAFVCQTHVRLRKTALVNMCASRDCANVNVRSKTTARRANVAKMVFA